MKLNHVFSRAVLLASMAFFLLPIQTTAQVASLFGSSREDWGAVLIPTDPETNGYTSSSISDPSWNSTTGNPAGSISLSDASSLGNFYFKAPSAHLGEKTDYYGGRLTFDLQVTGTSLTALTVNMGDIILIGGGLTIMADVGSNPPVSSSTWTSYAVDLNESAVWHIGNLQGATPSQAEFLAALGDLQAVYIRGEYYSGTDTAKLDNVFMQKPAASTFTGGKENWQAVQIPTDPETNGYQPTSISDPAWSGTAGNPAGSISLTDASSTSNFYFSASTVFLGDKTNFYGGQITFDLQVTGSSLTPLTVNMGDIILVGGGLTIMADLGSSPPVSSSTWTSFSAFLTESPSWHLGNLQGAAPTQQEFQTVLGNLQAIYIRGEYYSGTDTAKLDNVRMFKSPSSAFTLGREEWQAVQIPTDPETNGYQATVVSVPSWNSTVGNPAGSISLTDASSTSNFYFSAPTSFLGGKSDYYGGQIAFDLQVTGSSLTPLTVNMGDIILVGGGLTIMADLGSSPPVSSSTWTSFSIALVDSSLWHIGNLQGATPTQQEFLTVLGALQTIYLRGEYYSGTDTTKLDNVTFKKPASATFTGGKESWQAVQIPTDPETNGYATTSITDPDWNYASGNPAGSISLTDSSSTSNFFFSAPASFLGDKMDYYGREITFDLQVTGSSLTALTVNMGDIILVGGGLTIMADVGSNPPVSSSTWTSYAIGLSESSSWHVGNLQGAAPSLEEFLSVLSDLQAIYIRGEYYSGTDTAKLDNVKFF